MSHTAICCLFRVLKDSYRQSINIVIFIEYILDIFFISFYNRLIFLKYEYFNLNYKENKIHVLA